MTETDMNPQYRERSVFVDIVSWVFIILTGFGILVGIMQNIMVHTVFRLFEQHGDFPADMPPVAGFMFDYMPWMFALMLGISIFLFVSAINLYRRCDWARKVFIVMLLLGVLWNVAGLVFQFFFIGEIEQQAMHASQHDAAAEVFSGVMMAMRWFMTLFTIGLSALFGWIAWKLHTPKVREEFLPTVER